VRLARVIEETADDGTTTELHRDYHRMCAAYDRAPMKRLDEMISGVSDHLPSMGWPEIDADGLDRVRRVARAAWSGKKATAARPTRPARRMGPGRADT
jgi:hypothetical protein